MPHLLHNLEERLHRLPVRLALELPGGQRLGSQDADVRLRFADRLMLAALAGGQVGDVGAAIVEGRVEMEGSMRALMAAAAGLVVHDPAHDHTGWWTRAMARARSLVVHTVVRDTRYVRFHYDLSDDFFALWLDPLRVYSCAYYRTPDLTLAQAQEAKLDHICRKLRLRPGDRLLDVGAGWGGLLLWAAEHYGADATGITLSRNQHAHAQRRIAECGLQSRVRMQLCDFRQMEDLEPFDRIASVGMFEHVGRAQMPRYFGTLHGLLRPGGLLLNHGITAAGVDNTELGAGMGDFIEEYIFPGGELLHVSTVLHDLARSGLEMVDTENLRPHYARTLWAWSDALEAVLPRAQQVLEAQAGPVEAAQALRAYRLYLAGSALGFERGWISLHQILAARPDGGAQAGALPGAQSAYPFTRDYMYSKEVPCSTNSNPAPRPI